MSLPSVGSINNRFSSAVSCLTYCKNSAKPYSLDASCGNGPALETQSNSSLNSYIVTFILEIEDIEAAKAVKELKDKVKKYDIQYDFQDDIWDDI